MNLLLVDEAELVDGCARLTDRRADHLRQVLDVAVGQRLRAGIAGGAIGAAEVLARDAAAVTVRLCDLAPPPPPIGHGRTSARTAPSSGVMRW